MTRGLGPSVRWELRWGHPVCPLAMAVPRNDEKPWAGEAARRPPPPSELGEHLVEGAQGVAVELGEVAGDGPEHVPLGSSRAADDALVVFEGVHGLEDPV